MASTVSNGQSIIITFLVCLLVANASASGLLRRPKRQFWTTAKAHSTTTAQPKTASSTTAPRVVTGSSQLEWTKQSFPNPQLQPQWCSRGNKRSWVCDPNGILSTKEADAIDFLLEKQSQMGQCRCGKKCGKNPSHKGIQGAVALASKIYMKDRNPSSKDLHKAATKFAEYLRDEAWEFELCNDDYVIFISFVDRQIFTATGDNARPVMTDKCIKMVYERAQPILSSGKFGQAIELMVNEYTDILNWRHRCNQINPKNNSSTVAGIVGAIAACLGLAGCCGVCFYCAKKKGDAALSENDEFHHLSSTGSHHQPDQYTTGRKESLRRDSGSSGGAGGGF